MHLSPPILDFSPVYLISGDIKLFQLKERTYSRVRVVGPMQSSGIACFYD
jgi:hypothetical protein